MSKLNQFLKELDVLSRKYGIWIEVGENEVALVSKKLEVIAVGLYCDEDTQEYLVQKEFSV